MVNLENTVMFCVKRTTQYRWWSASLERHVQGLPRLGFYLQNVVKVSEAVRGESDGVIAAHAGSHESVLPWEGTFQRKPHH